jgi:hypothetical protein
MRDFTKIDKGLVDNTKLDDINQQIVDTLRLLIRNVYLKKKRKSDLILQKTLKELGAKLN